MIIVGCGKTGYEIAKVLSGKKGIDVTVVDLNPDALDVSAEPIDAIFVAGNGASERALIEAGAEGADLFVSTTDADELNVLCCIMAKRLGAKHTAARVRNPDYVLEHNGLWKDLGIDAIINPERQTAREISRLLRYPTTDGIDTFVNGRVELVSLNASEAPERLAGRSVSQAFNQRMGVLLAVVERGGAPLIPGGDFVIEEGDVLRLLGRPSNIARFLAHCGKRSRAQEVMVIGGGKITYYLAELLGRHAVKANVKIIEKDALKCEELGESLGSSDSNRRLMVIRGDGTNEDLLLAEDIGGMDAVACLTDRDEENAIISLYALKAGVGKVITKINHLHQSMIKNLGLRLGSIITPQAIAADDVTRYVDGLAGAVGSDVRTAHGIFSGGGGSVDAIEFHASKRAKCLDVPIRDLPLKKGILIGCVSRGSEIIIPTGDTRMRIGDSVIVVAKGGEIRDLDGVLAV